MTKIQQKKLPTALNIDYSNFDEKDVRGNYIYSPPGVLSLKKKSWALPGWDKLTIRHVEEQLTIYTDVPIKCKGESCEFADSCPLVKNGLVKRWIGQGCPVEIIDAFRHFAGYVNDLGIKSIDYTDIQTVNDLVRLQIHMQRCDKLMRLEKPIDTLVFGQDKRTDLKHSTRQINPLVSVQKSLREDISTLYKSLIASREAKAAAKAREKQREDPSNFMAEVLQRAEKEKENKQKDPDELEELYE